MGKRTEDCPTREILVAFERGELPDPTLGEMADHLANCVFCQWRLRDSANKQPIDRLVLLLSSLGSSGEGATRLASSDTLVSQELSQSVTPPLNVLRRGTSASQTSSSRVAESAVDPVEPALHRSGYEPDEEFFGGYRLLQKIGQGGMGTVYRAFDTRLKRTVALKMIRMVNGVSAQEINRFKSESEAVARLQHPNIVQIHELGEWQGRPFAALEFLAGGSLDRRIRETLPDCRTAARLMIAVALGVHAAHEMKLLHRDLKPSNILLAGAPDTPLESCVPKVSDFGLVKFLEDDESGLAGPNTGLGTPGYMAPEQSEGHSVLGPTADVYSLGATLYELLCGYRPVRVAGQEPVSPRVINRQIPRGLEAVCRKCLANEPSGRYPSAKAFADDLACFLSREGIVGRVGKLWCWCRSWLPGRP